MTICIAAICDDESGGGKKIVFCADRQISVGIQFEGGMPKYQQLTENCFIMDSTNDSLRSDLIIVRVKERIKNKEFLPIKDIANIVSEECENLKKEEIRKDLLWKYDALPASLKINSVDLLPFINQQLDDYDYDLECAFLIFGLESFEIAHIYNIDENGKQRLLDNLAFAMIGDGGNLALLEITKYPYSTSTPAVEAIARVHFAKRLAERAIGVGKDMDLCLLHMKINVQESELPQSLIFDISKERPDIIEELDNAFADINQYERDKVREVMPQKLYQLIIGKPEEEDPTTDPEIQEKH